MENIKKRHVIKKSVIEAYLLDCMSFEGYVGYHGGKNNFPDIEPTEKNDRIQLIKDIFLLEKSYEIKRVGFTIALADWFAGLPSCMHHDWKNHIVLNLGEKWGANLSTERLKDDFLSNWFKRLGNSMERLFESIKVKSIDIDAKKWFDSANGNTYFSYRYAINMGSWHTFPMQYGYDDQYEHEALQQMIKDGFIPANTYTLSRHCRENNITLNRSVNDVKRESQLKFK